MTWMLDALCRTRPSDWWDLGDDGNRLALDLCSVCPVLTVCSATAGAPAGVVRAGVAYRDSGQPAAMCACGRPVVRWSATATECLTCRVPDVPLPKARGRRDLAEVHEVVVGKLAAGWTYGAIGTLVGVDGELVRGYARRNGLRSVLSGRPAA